MEPRPPWIKNEMHCVKIIKHFSVNWFSQQRMCFIFSSRNHCHAWQWVGAAGKLITLWLLDSSANWQLLKVENTESRCHAARSNCTRGERDSRSVCRDKNPALLCLRVVGLCWRFIGVALFTSSSQTPRVQPHSLSVCLQKAAHLAFCLQPTVKILLSL